MRPMYSRCFSGPRSRGAILDAKLRCSVVRRQDSVLVVFERAVPNQETALFEADARAVAVIGARAAKFDSVDDMVAVAEHPDRLSLGDRSAGIHHWPAADAPNQQARLRPDGDVARVGSGRDLDLVAVARHRRGVGDPLELTARSDRKRCGERPASFSRRNPEKADYVCKDPEPTPTLEPGTQTRQSAGASARSGNSTSV